ncbi:hypothetical protein EP331_06450 [bacterium]|nr:MAG: hypothetical protein EP331_06450 [bacterium]
MKKQLFLPVLSLFLALIVFSQCEKRVDYQQKYAHTKEHWVKGVGELLALDSVETYPDDAILFMGSSSIVLWKTIHEDMKPYSAIRRGYGGSAYSDVIHFAEDIVSPHKVSAIVIFVANDIRNQPDDKDPNEVLGLFKENVRLIRKHHASVPIFSIAVTPTPSRWGAWTQIDKANSLIQNYCETTPNMYYINTVPEFLTADNMPDSSLFVQDMLHLNPTGYAKWTEVIKGEIQKVIPKN